MLAERLLALRTARDVTQDDVAAAVHVTRSAYQTYEKGSRRPSLETLILLSRYFRVTTDYLLGLSESPAPPPELDPRAIELIHCYQAADPRGQDTIYHLALQESLRFGDH